MHLLKIGIYKLLYAIGKNLNKYLNTIKNIKLTLSGIFLDNINIIS